LTSTLDQYRQAKGSIAQLEAAAKKELISKFRSLTAEIFAVQKELLEEFGVRLAIPKKAPVKARKSRKVAEAKEPKPIRESSPKIRALERKIATQRRKVAGADHSPIKQKIAMDRIYELEDELRLEREKA